MKADTPEICMPHLFQRISVDAVDAVDDALFCRSCRQGNPCSGSTTGRRLELL